MPLSDYFSPKQFAFTPDKAAAIGTGNEGQKFMSKSYDPTVNNLQSIGPAYWDYVAYTLDKAGKPRTDYTGMLQDMLGRYGTVTADTKAPDWFLKGERYNYFNPQISAAPATAPTATSSAASPNSYFKAPTPTPSPTPAGNNLASGIVTPQTATTPVTPSATPNTGTLGTDINQSPFSPTAGTRKRTSPNKYFNQRWFGTKQIA